MSEIQENNKLQELAFIGEVDKEILHLRLDTNLNIKVNFKKRSDLENKSFIFDGKKLFLAEDIKKGEIPSIIFRINQLTFGDKIANDASTNELKIKIVIALDELLKKSQENKKIIGKYVRLYSQLVGENEAQNLSKKEYREEIINSEFISQNERKKFLEKIKAKNNSKEQLDYLSEEIMDSFTESIFEKGLEDLGDIETSTQSEIKTLIDKYGLKNNKINLDKYKERSGITGFLESLDIESINFSLGFLEGMGIIEPNIVNSDIFNNLDLNEGKLREKMNIDYWKNLLEQARKNGNGDIDNIEKSATNVILKELYNNYPWNMLDLDGGFPGKIKANKEVYCIGFSLLGHRFLKELGIKHKVLNIPEHSALEINIGEKKYYFDPTGLEELKEFKYGNFVKGNDLDGNEIIGRYRETDLEVIINGKNEKLLVMPGNPEEILQDQIIGNLLSKIVDNINDELFKKNIFKKENTKEKLYIKMGLKLGLENNTINNENIFANLGVIYFLDKKYIKAKEFLNKALNINPLEKHTLNLLKKIENKIKS